MSRKKRKILFGSLLIGVFTFVISTPLVANAGLFDGLFGDDTEEIVTFLREHSDWLQYGSFLTIILHEVGWLLVKLFYVLTSFLEGLVPESLSLLDFLEDAGLDSVATAIINDLVVVLIILTLVFIGFKTVIAKEPPNFKSVGVNIFISAFLILGLPTLMNTMQDISIEFYDSTQKGENNGDVTSLAWGLVQDNTADLFYVAQSGFDLISNNSSNNVKNSLTPDIFLSTNLTELVTPDVVDDLESPSNEVNSLKYTLSNDGLGNHTAIEIDSSLLSWFSDSFEAGYFRYPAKFYPMLIGLLALSVAYLFTLFVFITTVIEIAIKRVVALFVFATDLESGQRTKMVLKDIMNAFLLIALTGLNLKIYTLFLTYLGTTDVNLVLYIIAIVSATFVLIKGSSTIMRYFGVDVGVKDGLAQVAGAFAVGKALAGMGQGKGKTGKNKTDSKDAKSQLNQQAEEEALSINDTGTEQTKQKSIGDALKNSINSAGKKAGYLSNRGIGGALEDVAKGTKEKMTDSINQKGQSLSNGVSDIKNGWKEGVNDIKSGWKEGINEGVAAGNQNRARWDQQKEQSPSINDQEVNTNQLESESSTDKEGINQANNVANKGNQEENGSNDLNNNKQTNEEILADMKLNDAMNKNATGNLNMDAEVNGTDLEQIKHGNSSGNEQSNEDILANMKLDDSIQPKNADGKMNMQTQSDNAQPTNDTNMLQQNIATDMKANSMPLNEKGEVTANMKVNPSENGVQQLSGSANPKGQQEVHRVLQKVEKSFDNPESAKQSIIQEVQQSSSFGSNDMKQKVIQDIERSGIATPEQVQQNVQQVLTSSRLPQDTQNSIQRVIQEVQTSGLSSPETAKTKVIQEVEKASFENETMKQNVIQDIQRAFNATPEQTEQNIKQTISAATNDIPQAQSKESTSKVIEEKVAKNKGDSKYFGSLLGSNTETETVQPRKNSRFEKFNKE
ncbi:pLS20_p028 family conjugation system transmembrane protein [Virgibacillus halodenitrificans]|uniref:pLS20_p028 family conjugation system transmembrane protein n=1 Tax=Virgibacillus halodenitrificans TaxID=1482 RepID=UPI00045C56A6|nr:hypothetical protein [Virgibacillus halodenitrificans]CDQ37711.1 hypothetical protein BN993_07273 [Virgibacillus halodenitrificans]